MYFDQWYFRRHYKYLCWPSGNAISCGWFRV